MKSITDRFREDCECVLADFKNGYKNVGYEMLQGIAVPMYQGEREEWLDNLRDNYQDPIDDLEAIREIIKIAKVYLDRLYDEHTAPYFRDMDLPE